MHIPYKRILDYSLRIVALITAMIISGGSIALSAIMLYNDIETQIDVSFIGVILVLIIPAAYQLSSLRLKNGSYKHKKKKYKDKYRIKYNNIMTKKSPIEVINGMNNSRTQFDV